MDSQSSSIAWTSANATSCSGTGKGFAPSDVTGSLEVSPKATTTYSVTCTGAGGSEKKSVKLTVTGAPTLAIGATITATQLIYPTPTPTPGATVIAEEAPGNQGTVIGGPVSNKYTWWQVAFDDNLTGWISQANIAAVSPAAPTIVIGASPGAVAAGASSTLSWSSTNATACTGTGFSAMGVSGSVPVSPTISTNYSITCAGSGGSTSQSVAVVVNPMQNFSWSRSLPIAFDSKAIVPLGGTETRALLFMDGSLYAGIGDWEDPQLENSRTPGAQVLRLDSPNAAWVEDQDFNLVGPATGIKDYQAIATLGTAHFDRDSNNNPITPIDVLMAGFWNVNMGGLEVGQKTVTTGSVGAQGTWTISLLVQPPSNPTAGQARSFASYTDSITNVEMAFAGTKPFGIFSGAFNSSTNSIAWGAAAEAGSTVLANDRVMSFAGCGGSLYASLYDAILIRTDGANPSWQIYYQYSGPALYAASSGFRGLTCVPNLNGVGSMLIAALEGNGDIYDIPLDGSAPTIELNTSNYLASQLGAWIDYVIAAYNNMMVDPQSGTTSCPTLLIGVTIIAQNYPHAYEGYYPPASFLERYCNGTYSYVPAIADPTITPAPPTIATRTLAVSQFSGDPAGTLYSGGYDAHYDPTQNTNWIYKGQPQ